MREVLLSCGGGGDARHGGGGIVDCLQRVPVFCEQSSFIKISDKTLM